jgi:hypothetical protein
MLLPALLCCQSVFADEPVHSMTLSLDGNLYQTASGTG